MTSVKYFYKIFFFLLFSIITTYLVSVYFMYRDAKEVIQRQVPELIRLVAEDNCLDDTIVYNGTTMYDAYMQQLQSTDANSPLIVFDPATAVSVTNEDGTDAYSRDVAKQRGEILTVTLTGNFHLDTRLHNRLFDSSSSTITIDVPITFEEQVIGTRYYRDR